MGDFLEKMVTSIRSRREKGQKIGEYSQIRANFHVVFEISRVIYLMFVK
jgi:hypothetical protein